MTSVEVISEMRDWLADCEWQDVEPEEIATLPAQVIIAAVERHYCGGKIAFLRSLA
jgi:hypothetical protein